MHKIRFWLLVVGMTSLIWIAADQRVTRADKISVPLQMRSAVPQAMSVRLLDGDINYIEIGFRGPNRSIARLRALQETLSVPLEISERASGRYELNLLDTLRGQMDLFPEGLAMVSTHPTTVSVEVDRYTVEQVPLRISAGTYEFAGAPQLNPDTVRVRVPERQFAQLKPDERAITIALQPLLEGQPEGQLLRKAVAVPRQLDGGLGVIQVDPGEVTLTATLSQHVATGRLRTVPILLLINKDITDQYEVEFVGPDSRLVTRPVTIRGPAALVADITENSAKYDVLGFVKITREDLPKELSANRTIRRAPKFSGWPKGIVLAEEPEPVEFRIVPRK